MTVSPVDCQQVEDESLAELYVARRLEGEIREAFEAHYMGCAACFDGEVHCSIMHCLTDCLMGDSPACTACRMAMCDPAFNTCSGLAP